MAENEEDVETQSGDVSTDDEPEESHGHLTLEGLNDKIDTLIEKVAGLGRRSSRATQADNADAVASQVKAEVSKIRQTEERTRREDRVSALENKVREMEKPPREYRRVTKWIWGDYE